MKSKTTYNGNITQITDNAQQTLYFNNSVIAPTYDALYRLKTATGRELAGLQMPTNTDFANNIGLPNPATNAMQNYTQQYQYDELGNILQMKSHGQWTRDYYYETDNNRLKNHDNGSDVYDYDNHGNITTMPHLPVMLWDYKDQLKEVTLNQSGDKAYYVYDASGERVRKIIEKTGGIVEERIYLGGYEIYRKTNNGTLEIERKSLFVEDGIKKIAQIDDDGTTETIRYQYDNHLGSASLELNENGDIISYEEYHPFGTTSYRSGRSSTEVSLKRYKYVGKERDEETGLYYPESLGFFKSLDFRGCTKNYTNRRFVIFRHYGARYYAAWLGRFVSVDPNAHLRVAWTPYNAMRCNPILNIDPDGALDTKYEDEAGNLLLETNDGSDDVVQVSNDKVEDFKYYAESYKDDGMKPVYDSKGWNDNMKADLLGFETTNEMNFRLDQLNSQWSRNAAIKYWQTGEMADGVSFAFKEALSQWTNPYLVVGGLSAGVAGLEAVTPKTNVYRVYGGDAQANGYSWTPTNPNSVPNFRNAAGLPSGGASGATNTGQFVIEGTVNANYIIKQRSALPLDGNAGGLPEYIINPTNVNVTRVSGANPEF